VSPDQTHTRTARIERLADATAKRTADAEVRARRAIIRLEQQNQSITIASVATAAGVSTSYLYAHPALRSAIRNHPLSGRSTAPRPREEQATAASLRTKLQVVKERLREVETQLGHALAENENLRGELVDLRRKQNRSDRSSAPTT